MIEQLFFNLLSISFLTSIVIILFLILSKVTNKYYFIKWKYWVWLIIMLRLSFPINISLPTTPFTIQVPSEGIHFMIRNPDITTHYDDTIIETKSPEQTDGPIASSSRMHSISILQLAMVVWLCGASLFLLYHCIAYFQFIKRIKKKIVVLDSGQELETYSHILSEMLIRHKPVLCWHPDVGSPMLFGFFQPVILLPVQNYNELEFSMIIQHELVHYRRKDIWYKLLLVLVRAIHWFNPIIHIASKQAEIVLEISCDEEVLKNSSLNFRKEYGEIMLNVMRKNLKKQTALSTHFYPDKKAIKQRFMRIIDTQKKYKGTLAFVLCLLVLILGTMGTLVACQKETNGAALSVDANANASNETSLSVEPSISPSPIPSLPMTSHYSNKNINFDYPSTWTFTENSTEDISYVKFTDPNSEIVPVFWFSKGEAWLTDFKRTEENYKALLSDSYQDVAITALKKTTIGGYDAIKLVFTYTLKDVEYTMIQYETIVGYASFKFNYTYTGLFNDSFKSIIQSIISSIEFT